LLTWGGVNTTNLQTHQQWDSPNGWAPLQWFAVRGLRNYNLPHHQAITERWLSMIQKRFAGDTKLLEKYDVLNIDNLASGGEYGVQEGFGWTNGVTLEFLRQNG
jgi:alpha,alpha-trehalase